MTSAISMVFNVNAFILVFVLGNMSELYGPIILDIPQLSKNVQISDDGSIIAATFLTSKSVGIYSNIGYTYELIQNITNSVYSSDVAIEGNGEMIAFPVENLQIYQKTSNQTFSMTQGIQFNVRIKACAFFHRYMFVGTSAGDGKLRIYERNENNIFEEIQVISDETKIIDGIALSDDLKLMATVRIDQFIRVYEKKEDGLYVLKQIISIGYKVKDLKIKSDRIVAAGISGNITFFKYNGTSYEKDQVIVTIETYIQKIQVSKDCSTISFGGDSRNFYIYRQINGSYELQFTYTFNDNVILSKVDEEELYYVIATSDAKLNVFYKCPQACLSCIFPNNCSECISDYELNDGICSIINLQKKLTHCVQDKYTVNNICQQYCHRKCKTCNSTKDDCGQCAELYVKNEAGECVVENNALSIFIKLRPFLNVIRRKGFKMVFLVIDDLWLYQYHKIKYDGTVKVVFSVISLIEEKQWEIIGLEGVLEDVEESIEDIPKYNPYSNPEYMFESRNNNFLIDSILDYLVFFIVFTLILVFLFNRTFYLLFNYQISKYLRPYSFWLIILEILVQGNIEYFSFLGIRAIDVFFSFNFASKCWNTFTIAFVFIVLTSAACSYGLYYLKYGKLARYFLVNLYRFRSSYILMIITYGFRPLLKGVIHALFFQEWVQQIWLLIGVELAIMIITVIFQVVSDNHKSTLMLILELSYFTCLIALNVELLLKYEYFSDNTNLQDEVQVVIQLTIYLMVGLLILRILAEVKEMVDCKCNIKNLKNNSISPEIREDIDVNLKKNQQPEPKKHKNKNKESEEQKKEKTDEQKYKEAEKYTTIKKVGNKKLVEVDLGNNNIMIAQFPGSEESGNENQVMDYYHKKEEQLRQKRKEQNKSPLMKQKSKRRRKRK